MTVTFGELFEIEYPWKPYLRSNFVTYATVRSVPYVYTSRGIGAYHTFQAFPPNDLPGLQSEIEMKLAYCHQVR